LADYLGFGIWWYWTSWDKRYCYCHDYKTWNWAVMKILYFKWLVWMNCMTGQLFKLSLVRYKFCC
jgi:hypothetical protein